MVTKIGATLLLQQELQKMHNSEDRSPNSYDPKYVYALVFQGSLCIFVFIMMMINIIALHTPMMMSVQFPLVIAFYCDIFYRYTKSTARPVDIYLNIFDVALLAYILYLTVVISYSDVNLRDQFFIVLQALDIALIATLFFRLVYSYRKFKEAKNSEADSSRLLGQVLDINATVQFKSPQKQEQEGDQYPEEPNLVEN